MGFLVQSILVYCLISLLIGGIIGWILKSFVCERDCEAKVGEWEAKYNSLDGKYKTLQASGGATAVSGDVTMGGSGSVDADFDALRAQIGGLEETNRLQANRIADLEGELNTNVQGVMAGEDLSARVELLEQDLAGARTENEGLAADLAAAREASSGAGDAVALAAQVATLQKASGAADSRAAGLENDLAACKSARADLEAALAEAKQAASGAGDTAQLEADLAACKSARTKVEAELAACTSARSDLEAKLSEAEHRAEAASEAAAAAAVAAPKAASKKKEVFTTDAPAPKNLMTEAPENPDDLKEIWGVGPVMEGVLNKLGFYTFQQVSELSDRDVEWVSANIGTFPDRIKRDEWVKQGGELHKKHHG